MRLTVVVLLGALAVGAARGGSLRRLSAVALRSRRLVLLAVVAQLLGGIAAIAGSSGGYDAGLVVSALAALGFCGRNLAVPGLALLALGLSANALVVAADGAMPVSSVQAARAGADVTAIAAAEDPRHHLASGSDALRWLGDVVPVPLPGGGEVDSAGDVLIAAGIAQFVVAGMAGSALPARRRRRRISSRSEKSTSNGPDEVDYAPLNEGGR